MQETSNSNIMCFRHDAWIEVKTMGLQAGDWFKREGRLFKVKSEPVIVDGKIHMDVEPFLPESEPIVIAVGDEYDLIPETLKLMDELNSGCRDFGDGTYMIAELEGGPGAIYSPRLSEEKLEDWCKNNAKHFEPFIIANQEALERGDLIKIEPWW